VVRKDLLNHLRGDPKAVATTMVDYYGLPAVGAKQWPGRQAATTLPLPQRAAAVESAVHQDVCAKMGAGFDSARFVPFVLMHEFEALLFSDCTKFAEGIGRADLARRFQQIRDAFGSPEEIDDSPATAPSKRVARIVPGYEKPLLGVLAVLTIGLGSIRDQCPHFRGWLERLEALPPAGY